jgi:NitT/TauT family transport system ATP-binding protein
MAGMTEPFISLRNVRKVFRAQGQEFLAVSDVTMDVAEGELISLVGPSGCGKTTVLKILAGLYQADGGSIRIGNARTPFDPARDIGMVFQQALLLKWRTILDNVLLPAEIVGLPIKAARTRARELLHLVGLAGHEDKYPQQLSGGMQQRTAIARAFIHDPKLVLMDEPFGALDALTREQMNLEMLKVWRDSGKTIIFVTHSIQEAVFLGSHCAVLTAGPARMAEYFPISLPFPRTLPLKTTEEFGAYARRIYERLGLGTGSMSPATALASPLPQGEVGLRSNPGEGLRTNEGP